MNLGNKMKTIQCTGRDEIVRTFSVDESYQSLNGKWTYRVQTIPPLADNAAFELRVEEIDSQTVRVVAAFHDGRTEYAAMGIPDALLPVIKDKLQKNVESSPPQDGRDYRTCAATKYWKRLLIAGKATHDEAEDVYRLV